MFPAEGRATALVYVYSSFSSLGGHNMRCPVLPQCFTGSPPPLRATSSTQIAFWKSLSRERPPPLGTPERGGGVEASLAYSAWYPADMAKSLYYTVSLWHSEHLVGLLALVFPASQVMSYAFPFKAV